MNTLVQFMAANGVPVDTIILILMVPVVVTVIAVSRLIFGVKGFGIYTPVIITFALVETGLKYGLAIFILVLLTGTLMRYVLRRFRILSLPRFAIVLSIVAIVILLLFAEGAYSHRTGLITVSIFPILIMITLVEKFVTAQIEKGPRTAIRLSVETLILAVACYYLVTWPWLQETFYNYPYIIFGLIILNILLGRYRGLRLSEYIRFREVIKHVELPQKR